MKERLGGPEGLPPERGAEQFDVLDPSVFLQDFTREARSARNRIWIQAMYVEFLARKQEPYLRY